MCGVLLLLFFNLLFIVWKGEYMVWSQKASPLVGKLLASSNLSSCINEDKWRLCVQSA